jgi:hypothetical protein
MKFITHCCMHTTIPTGHTKKVLCNTLFQCCTTHQTEGVEWHTFGMLNLSTCTDTPKVCQHNTLFLTVYQCIALILSFVLSEVKSLVKIVSLPILIISKCIHPYNLLYFIFPLQAPIEVNNPLWWQQKIVNAYLVYATIILHLSCASKSLSSLRGFILKTSKPQHA